MPRKFEIKDLEKDWDIKSNEAFQWVKLCVHASGHADWRQEFIWYEFVNQGKNYAVSIGIDYFEEDSDDFFGYIHRFDDNSKTYQSEQYFDHQDLNVLINEIEEKAQIKIVDWKSQVVDFLNNLHEMYLS